MPTIITRGAASARGFGFGASVASTVTAYNFNIFAQTGYDWWLGGIEVGYNYGDLTYSQFGSCTPAYPSTVGAGKFVAAVDQTTGTPAFGLQIEFPYDPGQNWLKSITMNGVTKASADAYLYYYGYTAPNQATWFWAGNIGLVANNSYSLTIRV